MNQTTFEGVAKLVVAAVMLGLWAYIRTQHVTGADDIVGFCQGGLVALASHYLTNFGAAPVAQPPGSITITPPPPTGGSQ